MPVGIFQPLRANNYVPLMVYHSDVDTDGLGIFELTTPAAASNTSIVSAHDLTVAGDAVLQAAATMNAQVAGTYGRNVRIVLSGAGAPTVNIRGRDYLGQPMQETMTGNGTTPVLGQKAFYAIERVTYTAIAATTLNVGFDLKFGLPFRANKVIAEAVNGDAAAAGTFVAALALATAPTAINADTRGTLALNAANLADGARSFEFQMIFDMGQLHGARHFFS